MAEQGPAYGDGGEFTLRFLRRPHRERGPLRREACVVALSECRWPISREGRGTSDKQWWAPPARLPYRFLFLFHARGHLRHGTVDGDAVIEIGHVLAAVDRQRFGGV